MDLAFKMLKDKYSIPYPWNASEEFRQLVRFPRNSSMSTSVPSRLPAKQILKIMKADKFVSHSPLTLENSATSSVLWEMFLLSEIFGCGA